MSVEADRRDEKVNVARPARGAPTVRRSRLDLRFRLAKLLAAWFPAADDYQASEKAIRAVPCASESATATAYPPNQNKGPRTNATHSRARQDFALRFGLAFGLIVGAALTSVVPLWGTAVAAGVLFVTAVINYSWTYWRLIRSAASNQEEGRNA